MASSAAPLNAPRLSRPYFPLGSRPALAGWVSLACRLVVAGVLLAASLSKITDPVGTVRAVRAYKILPESLVTPFAHALPWVELALATLLVVGLATRVAGALSALLLATFLGGIISVAARGLSIDCGCFGGGGVTAHPHYTGEIVRDTLLLLAAVAVAVIPVTRLALDPQPPAPVPDLTEGGTGTGTGPAGSGVTGSGSGPSGKAESKDAARRHRVAVNRYNAERAEASSRLRLHAAIAGVAIVGLALVGIGVGHSSATASTLVVPTAATADGGILVGSPSAPHHLVTYEDPQCPICGDFESASGATIDKALAAGKVNVEYHLMSFLGPESLRAVAALGAASQEGKFEQLRSAMFAHQPAERSGGYTISDLVSLGRSVGLTDAAYVTAVQKQTYAPWAKSVEEAAEKAGVTGTPTVTLDGGKPLDLQTVLLQPATLAAMLGVA